MNKRRQNKVMRAAGIKSWPELSTIWQFKTLLMSLCDLEKDDAAFILAQIQGLRELSDQYFDETSYTVVNHEPQIMFELEGARGYINGILDAGTVSFAKLAEAYRELCSWARTDSSVVVEAKDGSTFYSVAEAVEMLEVLEAAVGGEDADEQINMIYEGAMTEPWLAGEQDSASGDLELDLEAILERVLQQAEWGEDLGDLNSRLN